MIRRTGIILGIVALVSLVLAGCGTQAIPTPGSAVTLISAQELATMLQDKDFTLINVHIPYAGEIPQTDAFIPYNELERYADQLPATETHPLWFTAAVGV